MVVREKFREISERLGDLGHNLTEAKPEYDSEFSSWNYEYNDDSDENSLRIWLNTQTGVMSGYVESEEVIA